MDVGLEMKPAVARSSTDPIRLAVTNSVGATSLNADSSNFNVPTTSEHPRLASFGTVLPLILTKLATETIILRMYGVVYVFCTPPVSVATDNRIETSTRDCFHQAFTLLRTCGMPMKGSRYSLACSLLPQILAVLKVFRKVLEATLIIGAKYRGIILFNPSWMLSFPVTLPPTPSFVLLMMMAPPSLYLSFPNTL